MRAGMTGQEIMNKYQLSPERFESVMRNLTNERAARRKAMIEDIRSGMPFLELRKKFKLSSRGLQSVLKNLVDSGDMLESEVRSLTLPQDESGTFESMDELPRHCLVVPLPIHEDGIDIEWSGKLRHVTEKSLRIEGLQSKVGEVKTFTVDPTEFIDIHPIVFDAECLWANKEDTGDWTAGYGIINISPESLQRLRKLIQEATFVA
jgi:hypothetical protein